jgi:LemA protein
MIGLYVLLAVVVLLILFVVAIYNKLVGKRNRVKESWAQIDVQLKRRYDLIPNLVETVRGYASHEKETFDRVTMARTAAINASGVQEQARAENLLTGALKSLFAVAEAYPQLKANENFMQLQEELTSTENKIGFARQHYNDVVRDFNTAVQQVPANVVAGTFGFKEEAYFEIEEPAVREAPKVKF